MFNENYTSIPTDGLVLDLPLDWDANARVGSDWTATNVTWVASERWYTSEVGSFNGSSSYVSHNAPILTTQATFSFWIYPNNAGIWLLSIVSNWENARYRIDLRNNKLEAIFWWFDKWITTNWTWDTPLVNVDNNIYQYFTITVDWNNIKVYKNWILKQSSLKASDTNTSWSTSLIWCEPDSWDIWNLWNWFPWNIGLLKIYNKALSQNEIDALYSEGLRELWPADAEKSNGYPFYTPASLNEWKVLEISRPQNAWTYYDQSWNGNNGTATNVTDSSNGLYNVMSFNGSDSKIETNYSLDWTQTIIFNFEHNWLSWNFYTIYDNTFSSVDRSFLSYRISSPFFIIYAKWTQIISDSWLINFIKNKKNRIVIQQSSWDNKIYINWILRASSTTTFSWTSNSIKFWENFNGGGNISWKISNIKIYNKALSEQEILEDYYSSYISN